MTGAIEDLNFGSVGNMVWSGAAGGPLEGVSDDMMPCWTSDNGWFTDVIDATVPLGDWETFDVPGAGNGGACGTFAIFSVIPFECSQYDVVGYLYNWFGTTATEDVSISNVKTLY
jgi:hypothetical protein